MTSVELNERIARANAMCDKLNNERQLNLGKKETLRTQLDSAIKEYAAQYGVTLTKETLQIELNRVQTEKETELNNIESIITLINEGNYVEARRLAGENVEEIDNTLKLETPNMVEPQKQKKDKTKVVETPTITESVVVPPTVPVMPMTQVETPIAPSVSVPPTVPVSPMTPTVDNNVVPNTPVTPSVPVPPTIPVMPTVQNTPVQVVPPTTPSIPSAPMVSNMGVVPTPPTVPTAPNVLGGALEGFQPAPTMMNDVNVAPPTTFQSILGGTSFEG